MTDDRDAAELRRKSTTIGHADHLFLSPLSEAKADWLISLLDPPRGAVVLDIGCGKAGFLRRLLRQRPAVRGIGVDTNPAFIADAAEAAKAEGLGDRLTLKAQSAETLLQDQPAIDILLCFGASQALGDFEGLIAAARRALRPGGLILVGEGFWQRPPQAEYLHVLGATADELNDHAGNAARLRANGFDILATSRASPDEWDHYEGLYCRAKTLWARNHPTDPDAAQILAAAQAWHDAYLRWGRETLGFGWYLAAASGR
jgi:SAM-dependent methyltransferase